MEQDENIWKISANQFVITQIIIIFKIFVGHKSIQYPNPVYIYLYKKD